MNEVEWICMLKVSSEYEKEEDQEKNKEEEDEYFQSMTFKTGLKN